jgi:hypothetical protein
MEKADTLVICGPVPEFLWFLLAQRSYGKHWAAILTIMSSSAQAGLTKNSLTTKHYTLKHKQDTVLTTKFYILFDLWPLDLHFARDNSTQVILKSIYVFRSYTRKWMFYFVIWRLTPISDVSLTLTFTTGIWIFLATLRLTMENFVLNYIKIPRCMWKLRSEYRFSADPQVWPWPLGDGPGFCVRHNIPSWITFVPNFRMSKI